MEIYGALGGAEGRYLFYTWVVLTRGICNKSKVSANIQTSVIDVKYEAGQTLVDNAMITSHVLVYVNEQSIQRNEMIIFICVVVLWLYSSQ